MINDELLKSIQNNIKRYLKSIIFCEKDAEDILQETNLILIKKRKDFDESKPLIPWAMTIVRFQIKKYLTNKKRWNTKYVNRQHEDYPLIQDPFFDITKNERQELDKEVKSYLSNMQYNIYIFLTKGYSISEIAEEMEISPQRVSRSKSEMIRKMKIFMAKKNENINQYAIK